MLKRHTLKRPTFLFALASVCGLTVHGTQAAAQEPATVHKMVGDIMKDYDLPGAAAAVVTGKAINTYGLGQADISAATPVDPDRTIFPIDSITKTLTATVVMSLVDDGTVHLDVDVNQYLDAVDVEDTYPSAPVTLRHLLTHTAGFEEQVVGILGDASGPVEQLDDHLARNLPERVRPPGVLAAYSNYGLALAGQAAADAAGLSFDQLAAQRLLRPLQLMDTNLSAEPPESSKRRAARLYDSEGGLLERHGDLLYPAGGTLSTAADMGAFMRMQLAGGSPVLSPETTSELHGNQFTHDPRLPGMALAFQEAYSGGTRMLTHGGDGPGSHSRLTIVPERKLGVFVVFNGDGLDGEAPAAATAAVNRLLHLLLGRTDLPDGPAHASGPANAAEARSGTYRTTRMNYTDYTSLFLAMGSDAVVSVESDGRVTIAGLSTDSASEEQRWMPLGDGLYREQGGSRLIAFADRDGRIMLYEDASAYEKVPWYGSVALLLGCAAVGLILVLSLAAWPTARLLLRVLGRRVRPDGRGERTASTVACVAGTLIAAFVVALSALAADSERFELAVLQGSPTVGFATIPIAAAIPAVAAMLVCTALAWRRRWWGIGRRLHYTLAATGAATFGGIAHLYNFTVTPMTLLG
jgi:CubicO group peptidase (beta-lactamase class C family)